MVTLSPQHIQKMRTFLALALAIGACTKTDEYGYVAQLGNDTTSIEYIKRSPRRVVGEGVEQSPRVIRKRWEAHLDSDGRIRRWSMDKTFATPLPGESEHASYLAEYAGDSVLITERTDSGTRRFVIQDAVAVTVPWEAYTYGLYDQMFAAAVAQSADTVPIKQYLPGYGFAQGVIRKRSGDTLTFVTGGLAGTGIATIDANRRMLTYSGKHTTYKHEVRRIAEAPDFEDLFNRFAAREKAAPVKSLSVRDTLRATVGAAVISIEYSRPLQRGRKLLGELVPYGVVWRTGANAATHLTTSAPISIAGIDLDAGTYTVWTLPEPDGATLIMNRQTKIWGTRYNPKMDLGRAALVTRTLQQPVETFTFRIEPETERDATLVMEWGTFQWSAPIRPR